MSWGKDKTKDSARAEAAEIAAEVVRKGHCRGDYDPEVEEILADFNIFWRGEVHEWILVPPEFNTRTLN